jgi:hypothetical protein
VDACSFAKQQGQRTRLWWFEAMGSSPGPYKINDIRFLLRILFFQKLKAGLNTLSPRKKGPAALTDA